MRLDLTADKVRDLPRPEQETLARLLRIFEHCRAKNATKERYYKGKISLDSVNLGIALPEGIRKLEIGCSWGGKTVDVLAGRSRFDGFVSLDGTELPELSEIVRANRLISTYQLHTRDELKFGCTFATLSRDPAVRCRIRFHTPQTAAAEWDGEKGRISAGFAVIAARRERAEEEETAALVNLYTEDTVWVLRRTNGLWTAERHPQKMGRPLMEPMIWNPTSARPLGQSRINEPVRRLIEGYVRTVANASIGLEFATSPQKYLLGVTDDQYDALVNNKFKQYVGSIITSTTNPDTGEKPAFGQLPQGNIQPHVDMLRILSTQFSAATGLSVTDTGVVNDANPTSSDAILAQTKTLTDLAENLNAGNAEALHTISQMALAIANDTTLDKLTEEQRAVVAHFKSPAMPSLAATADAAVKIATARQSFAQTDVFLEMMGFDPAEIRRIKAQEQRARGVSLINELGL